MCENAPQCSEMKALDADREAWLLARLRTVVGVARAAQQARNVGADGPIIEGAIEGACNGAAIEIARMLGYEPGFVNIKPIGGPQGPTPIIERE